VQAILQTARASGEEGAFEREPDIELRMQSRSCASAATITTGRDACSQDACTQRHEYFPYLGRARQALS